MDEKSAFDTFELEVNEDIKVLLKETASWTYFLSIIGFIGIGILVVFGLFFGAIMSSGALGNANPYTNMGIAMGPLGFIYVVMGLIYFFPVLYLFNFSRKMKQALSTNNNNNDFKLAITNLKSHYKFMGIFTIVIFSIYILAFVVGLIAAAAF